MLDFSGFNMRWSPEAFNAGDPGLHSGQRDEYLPSHSSLFRVVGCFCVLGLSGLGVRGWGWARAPYC